MIGLNTFLLLGMLAIFGAIASALEDTFPLAAIANPDRHISTFQYIPYPKSSDFRSNFRGNHER